MTSIHCTTSAHDANSISYHIYLNSAKHELIISRENVLDKSKVELLNIFGQGIYIEATNKRRVRIGLSPIDDPSEF
jgi:hypothetical protein